MARPTSFEWDTILLGGLRQPEYRVYIYDIRSGQNVLSDIVVGNPLDPLTGPRDFSDDVFSVQFSERAGDLSKNGINASSVVLTIRDPYNQFDPENIADDPEGDGRWLRRGNAVRVVEGDLAVPESQWLVTFTGLLAGQAGVKFERTGGGLAHISVKAYGREQEYLANNNTSRPYEQTETFQQIARSIAEEDMGLLPDEIEFSNWGSDLPGHTTTQFADEPSIVSISKLMFPYLLVPRFNGEGKLTDIGATVTRSPDREYLDGPTIFTSLQKPYTETKPVDSICILGLDRNMSKVKAPRQAALEVSITAGFFSGKESVKGYFSDDKTQMGEKGSATLNILRSINSTLFPVGHTETLYELPADTASNPLDGAGINGAIVEADTGLAGLLFVSLIGAYVGTAAIPDSATLFKTIPVGRIIQALVMQSILQIVGGIGNGRYEVVIDPFEWVFAEIKGCARDIRIKNSEETRNEVEVMNHLIDNQTKANDVAREVLFYETARGYPRDAKMLHDIKLEPMDLFRIHYPTTGEIRTFLVGSVTRKLQRGSTPIANLKIFEATPGVTNQ